jgi:predicted nucleotidyltransferase
LSKIETSEDKLNRRSILQEISSGSVKIISIRRDELLKALTQICQQMCNERAEVKEIRLFGSLARGDQVGTSDVDLMVVVEGAGPADPVKAALDYLPYFALPVGVDLLVTGEVQVEKRLAEGDPFMERAWRESVKLAPV